MNKPFTFWNSFNMGVEGHSKALKFKSMNRFAGNRGEFGLLLAFLAFGFCAKTSTRSQETSIRASTVANNEYFEVAGASKQLSKWDN